MARVLPLVRRRHRSHAADHAPRRIAIVAFPDVQLLDVTGPYEVFAQAGRFLRPGSVAYAVEILTTGARPITSSSGVRLLPDRSIRDVRGELDTVLVAGGPGVRSAMNDRPLLAWLRRVARRARRLGSVCSGTFVLAEAGLLDGRRVTTHWGSCELLARRYPRITVEPDPIFVRDRAIYTSAGVTAGMDLSLALVEEDLGRRAALEVARWLVLFLKRPGGQSQFSTQLSAQIAEREPLRELQAWIADNLDADLSVPALAERVCMSPRNFARAFRREVGLTPAAYVEAARVETARIALDGSQEPIEAVARRCGFGTVETMRRAFHRRLGVGPSSYRDRFRGLVEQPEAA
jgi:transcriptional regulator GlxA family with amidase domain